VNDVRASERSRMSCIVRTPASGNSGLTDHTARSMSRMSDGVPASVLRTVNATVRSTYSGMVR